MRLSMRKRMPGDIEFGIIYGVIAALGLAAAKVLPLASLVPSCPFYGFTGLPCPSCGGTRALVALAQGDLPAALSLNPLVALSVAGALALFVVNAVVLVFRLPRPAVELASREQRLLRFAAALVVMVQWWYLVRTL